MEPVGVFFGARLVCALPTDHATRREKHTPQVGEWRHVSSSLSPCHPGAGRHNPASYRTRGGPCRVLPLSIAAWLVQPPSGTSAYPCSRHPVEGRRPSALWMMMTSDKKKAVALAIQKAGGGGEGDLSRDQFVEQQGGRADMGEAGSKQVLKENMSNCSRNGVIVSMHQAAHVTSRPSMHHRGTELVPKLCETRLLSNFTSGGRRRQADFGTAQSSSIRATHVTRPRVGPTVPGTEDMSFGAGEKETTPLISAKAVSPAPSAPHLLMTASKRTAVVELYLKVLPGCSVFAHQGVQIHLPKPTIDGAERVLYSARTQREASLRFSTWNNHHGEGCRAALRFLFRLLPLTVPFVLGTRRY